MKLTDPAHLLVLPFASGALAQSNASCYFPNGDRAKNYKACSANPSDTGVRSCCRQNELCLSNGLCFGPTIGCVYRGGCTDRTFQDANCPRIFLNAHPSGWANLINCPQTPQWQVDSGSCNDKDVYTWKAAEFLGISFTTHLPTSTAASSTVTVTVTSAGNPAVMAAAETAPVCADNKSDTSSHMKVGLAVGLGLGIPLLGLAAAFAALWLREVRKNRATSYSEMAVHKPIEGQPRDLYEADTRNAETQELDAGQGGAGVSYR